MKKILITGATGNIGKQLIRFICNTSSGSSIIAGVRDIEKAEKIFQEYDNLELTRFDFEDADTFGPALENIDSVFLLRPPHISDVDKYFRPLILKMTEKKVGEVVFLSVQGAEKSSVIPHNKIERLIKQHDLDYVFLRPSYFMQNLTTTLLDDIKFKRKILLPAGKAKFNWIDIDNIAEVASIILERFPDFKNREIEITGNENADFYKVSNLISKLTNLPVEYIPLSPLSFFILKKKEGMKTGMILVMIMLHYLPRFQNEPVVSDFYLKLTGKMPTSLEEFICREGVLFQ